MAYITRRKRALDRHPLAHGAGLGAALLTGLMASAAHAGDAQTTTQTRPTSLANIHVEAVSVGTYKADTLSSSKFTQPVSETPQTVQIITNDLISDQHATTLTEALRNSAGVGTFYVGENGSTNTGDDVYMRGFDSSGSIFVDGVRDLGSISRDTFNIEQVEVIKGPAGTDYGRTAPSGSINMVTKQPRLENSLGADVSYGSGQQKRASVDWNRAIGNHGAFRLNLMDQGGGVPGRDEVKHRRFGIAPSLAFGLDTPTRVYIDALHVKQNNVPDGGVPTVGLPGYTSPDPTRPSLADAPQVDTHNFYGTDADHDNVTADMATVIIEHDLPNHGLLRNTTRWGRTKQDYLLSSFMSAADYFNTPDLADPGSWSIRRLPNFKDQTNRILTNQTGIITHADTGSVSHTFSYGLELTREKVSTTGVVAISDWPDVNLYHPQHSADGLVWGPTGASGEGTTDTVAGYLFDTMKFAQRWEVTGGVRIDHYKARFQSTSVCGGRRGPDCGDFPAGTPVPDVNADVSDNLFNWKLGVLYKLTDAANVYVNYAIAAQPPGGDNLELSSRANSADNPNFDPVRSRSAEVGAKWNLAGDRLLLTAALYRTTVSNQVEQDPVDQQYYQTGKKRVDGVELSAVGKITPDWAVSAGFTTMHARIVDGAAESQDGSNDLAYTPNKAFTSWTSYHLPFGLTIGGGARYADGLKRGHDGAVGTPDHTQCYWVFDAMASYPINRHLDVQLNVYNLFDKDYVAAINKSGYRYTPGTPRSATLTLNLRF
ncbi:catecholate siderophore receptor Fiu [Oleiagrimonas sp. C23AA]|uniref:catecholate siderophore receptor Fiu n=1 Tax=Oleiagrimonas sp. C23AA TaxID=2719047 RepID=UPI00142075ED|nr:catecholate siderophore receptor Fiu [Oleiagrimonas sp. C23AA]NII10073.1 catecholate siderophore receptor Fiu [Oleiagrimonas sp. C23AA]